VVLTAFSLRTTVSSVGTVLPQLRSDLALPRLEVGVLTSLPVLCFAIIGPLAPLLARRFGLIPMMSAGIGLMLAGAVLRPSLGFVGWSIVAYAGCALVNVLIPGLVQSEFPRRVAAITAAYSTALAVGVASASLLTPVIARDGADWRRGLIAWALPIGAAALVWVIAVAVAHGRDRAADPARRVVVSASADNVPRQRLHRDRLPRESRRRRIGGVAVAVYFGTQGLQSYVALSWMPAFLQAGGSTPAQAGAYVALLLVIAVPISMVVPLLVARLRSALPVVLALAGCYALGYAGLLWDASGPTWLWMVAIGTGAGAFPLVLTIIGRWSPEPRRTAGFSSFAQGIGYLIAIPGPLIVGLISTGPSAGTALLAVLAAAWFVHLAAGVVMAVAVAEAPTG
jgi:CP family cyanate transporter-like MFS transporter